MTYIISSTGSGPVTASWDNSHAEQGLYGSYEPTTVGSGNVTVQTFSGSTPPGPATNSSADGSTIPGHVCGIVVKQSPDQNEAMTTQQYLTSSLNNLNVGTTPPSNAGTT